MSTLLECPHCRTDDIKHGATVCKGCGAEIVYKDPNADTAATAATVTFVAIWALLGFTISGWLGFIAGLIGGGWAYSKTSNSLGKSEKIVWNRRQNATRK